MNYWLMKTEPKAFSIQNLKESKNKVSSWDGVRNYQARNFMRDDMKNGDMILLYHSSCKNVGVAGTATVVKESHPDLSSLDKKSPYFDPKATKSQPRWYMVDIMWKKSFKRIITLSEIKSNNDLKSMTLVQKGSRLSIMPVTKFEFETILSME